MFTYHIIANWKMNLSLNSVSWWLDVFTEKYHKLDTIEVAIAPSFTELSLVSQRLKESSLQREILIYSQDVSNHEKGAITGDVAAFQLEEYGVRGTIVGHSERRGLLNESLKMINEKIVRALEFGITPVVCVSNIAQVEDLMRTGHISSLIIAYEPLGAIGSGNPENPVVVDEAIKSIKELTNNRVRAVLYGGSITKDTVVDYLTLENVQGFLVGGASLDPNEFLRIIDTIHQARKI